MKSVKKIPVRSGIVCCAVFLFSILYAGNGFANVYVPTTFTDHAYTTIDNATGVITGGAGIGSITLRSALQAADALGGTHTITLSTGTYNLSRAPNSQITIGNTAQNITINGNGPANTIINMVNDANKDRILFINPSGTTNSPVITVSGITFQNGYLTSDFFGGAALCSGGGSAESLTVTNCAFNNNTLPVNAYGGAAINVQVRGNLTIDNCTFTNNISNDADGGAILFIIFNSGLGTGFGTMSVTNSTFTSNSVQFPGATNSNGGAIAFTGQAGVTPFNATINNNTFITNTADGLGGAIVINNSPNVSIPQVHFNRFFNNTSTTSALSSGLHFVESSGSVNAENNWWGCNTNPVNVLSTAPCNQAGGDVAGLGSLDTDPWLQLKTTASPNPICNTPAGLGNTTLVTTSFLSNSAGGAVTLANISRLIGLPVTWSVNSLGALSGQQATIQASGTATATFTANVTGGAATVNTQVDNVPIADPTARANITVLTLPTVTNPANFTSCVGGTATFTSTITGNLAPTIQWRIGATPLVNGLQVSGSTVSGQGTATLTITNVQVGDASANYNVLASNSCGTATSADATLTVNAVTGGTVGSDQTICSGGDPALFTESVASTGSGALTYQWQSSTTIGCAAGFSNIVGATATTYDPPAGLAVTTLYRRVTTSTLNAVPCPAFSNCITVTVNDVTGGTVATDQTICSGGDPALFTESVASTGSGALTYQWQSSTTSCAAGFSDIGGATAITYDPPAGLLVTTFYRRVTTSTLNAVLCTANSNCITVSVNDVTGGTVATDQTICSGGDPALFTQSVASTGSGALTYQWQSSTTSCAAGFSNIGGATATTYDAPTGLLVTTFYRRVTTSTLNSVACTANSNCITVTVNNVTGGTVGSDQSIPIGGDPAVFTEAVASTGSGALTYQWQSSTTSCAAGFSNIGGANSATYDAPAGLLVITYYRRVTTSTLNGVPCTANSNCITVTVSAATCFINLSSAAGTNNQTVCNNTSIINITYSNTAGQGANGASVTGLPAGVSGSWLADVVTISGTPSAGGTFTYTVTLAGGSCAGITVNGTINVNDVTGGTVAADQTVCSGGDPALFTQSVAATGTGALTYQWQSNTTSCVAAFTNIAGATLATYDAPSGLAVTTYYRRVTTSTLNAVACTANSNCITVTVNDVTGGTVGSDQTICSGGDPAVFTESVASTGSGALTYQWQSSTTSCAAGFSNIAGATGTTYDPPSGLAITTFYRRVTTSTLNAVPCTANSNCVTVTVNNVTGGTVAADQTICSGGDPAAFTQSIASTGAGVLTYQWQSSTTSCAAGFSDIGGATSTTYDVPSGLAITTFYRRVTTSTLNAVPCTANSNCITVTVNNVTGGTVATDQTICSGGDPAAYTESVASTGSGTLTYQWQSSTTSCAAGFSNIGGATATTYDPPAGLLVTTFYRRVTTSTLNAVPCTANSNCITVTINNVTSGTVAADQTICSGGDPAVFTESVASTGSGPLTYQWQSSTTSCAAGFSDIGGATATTYDPPAGLLVTTYYRRVTTSIFNAVLCTANSNCITVAINNVTGGTVGTDQAVCPGGDPAVFTQSVASTGGGALTYQWQSSTTSCAAGFSDIGGATATTYDPPAGLLVTTYYRRVTTSTLNAVLCTANSNCITVTVNPINTITLTSAAGTDAQTVLINTPITNITYSTTGATGATFSGLPTGVNGVWAANVVTISGTPSVAGLFNYTVTLTGGCGSVTASGTINVIVCSITRTSAAGTDAQTVCINTAITNITYSTTGATGANFSGLPAGVTGNWAANIATISGTPTASGTFNYTVTLTGGGCSDFVNGSITVTPNNTITLTSAAGTDAQAVCINTAITNITYSTTGATGATFSGLPASVTGNWAANVVTISGTATVSGIFNYTVTLTGGCGIITANGSITVNPTPNAVATPSSQTICSANPITTIVLSGAVPGTVFNWTRNNTVAVTGIAASGSGNISGSLTNTTTAPVTVTFTITPTANGCPGAPITATVLVNPTPNAVATPASQTICSAFPITTIVLSGNVTGTTFNWTRDNTATVTGIAASGSGNISGTLTNTTNASITVTFTITPTANGCPGTPTSATVLVNPTPNAVATPSSQTICSGTAITTIVLSSAVTGTTYSWTRNNTATVTGIAASGTGNISGTLTNTTTAPVTVTFTITPTANGCAGTPITATVTVQAPLVITCPANITIPSVIGGCTAVVTYAPVVTGTPAPTFTYSFSGATTGSGNGTGSGSAFNVGVTTVTITATNSCSTVSCSFTITVTDSQLPVISSQPVNKTVCAGSTATFSVTSTNAVSYQWQQFNGTTWVNITGATGATLTLTNVTVSMNTNSYRVNVIGLCTTVTSGFATLYVNTLPTIILVASRAPVLLPGQSLTITASVSPTGGTIVWKKIKLDGTTVTLSNTSFTLSNLTVDYAIYTDPNGCVSISANLSISGQPSGNLYVYPNPNPGQFHVRFFNQSNESVTLKVYDSRGVLVYQQKFITTTPYSDLFVNLGTRVVTSGVYLVEVRDAAGKLIGAKRIVIGHP